MLFPKIFREIHWLVWLFEKSDYHIIYEIQKSKNNSLERV
jgi:hypothetical protein